MNKTTLVCFLTLLLIALIGGCGSPTKLQRVETEQMSARLALSRNEIAEERRVIASAPRDTITVTGENGETLLLMKAVKDEESGEMVAHDVINAAVITARFRNVAERHGRVDLRFEVIVPEEMIDTRWQLQFYPDMFILEDSIRLEPVIITGRIPSLDHHGHHGLHRLEEPKYMDSAQPPRALQVQERLHLRLRDRLSFPLRAHRGRRHPSLHLLAPTLLPREEVAPKRRQVPGVREGPDSDRRDTP